MCPTSGYCAYVQCITNHQKGPTAIGFFPVPGMCFLSCWFIVYSHHAGISLYFYSWSATIHVYGHTTHNDMFLICWELSGMKERCGTWLSNCGCHLLFVMPRVEHWKEGVCVPSLDILGPSKQKVQDKASKNNNKNTTALTNIYPEQRRKLGMCFLVS